MQPKNFVGNCYLSIKSHSKWHVVFKCLQAGETCVHPVDSLMFLMIADANEQEYLVRSLRCRNGFRDAACAKCDG